MYSFGSSTASQEYKHDRNLPGLHRSAPERGHLRFPTSGSSADFTVEAPQIPGSLSTPDSECDTMTGSYLLQQSPSRPPQPLSHYLVSGSDAAAYEASHGASHGYAPPRFQSDPPSNPSQASQNSMSFPPEFSDQGSIPQYGSNQYFASTSGGYDNAANPDSFMDYEHDTAAFMASLPSGHPQRYHFRKQNW